MYHAGVLTISDKGSRGERADASGDFMVKAFKDMDIGVVRYEIVPDEQYIIASTLSMWADSGAVDFIITTGGTGLAPRDVTPEATKSVIQREVPGIAEIMRMDGFEKTPTAVLSRGIAGVRGVCLIINMPGNPKAVKEYLDLLLPIIPHAIETIHGRIGDHI
jgi:molybdopterin adenylyltransferase